MRRPTLCVFCDASEQAFGACVYIRWELDDGSYDVRFVTAKSRVAPLKELTLPRLELQAAVVAMLDSMQPTGKRPHQSYKRDSVHDR